MLTLLEYNSCMNEHTEVLRDYLPESDAACFLINYRAGLRKSDLEYFSLISDIVKGRVRGDSEQTPPSLFVAINFVPSSSEDKRIVEIRGRLREQAGYHGPIYSLQSRREGSGVTLHDENLVAHMRHLAGISERTQRLFENSLTVIEDVLSRIGYRIQVNQNIFQAEESNLGLILKRIDELLSMQRAMEQRVSKERLISYKRCPKLAMRVKGWNQTEYRHGT